MSSMVLVAAVVASSGARDGSCSVVIGGFLPPRDSPPPHGQGVVQQ
jgi:hypothetical protein